MIGNDVVDLELAKIESNWKRKGYVEKIFTKEEQLLISNFKNQDNAVWILWSRKEAAYKIYNRQSKIRSYIPLEFHCHDLSTIEGMLYGKVICKGNTYYTRTEITLNMVHTIAVNHKSDFDKVQYLTTPSVIKKNKTIPYFYDGSTIKPLSISHHGRFHSTVALF